MSSKMSIYKQRVWVEQRMTCKEKRKRAFYFSLAFLHKHIVFDFLSEGSLRSAAYTMPLRSSPSRLCSADRQKSRLSLVLSCPLSLRSSQAWLKCTVMGFSSKAEPTSTAHKNPTFHYRRVTFHEDVNTGKWGVSTFGSGIDFQCEEQNQMLRLGQWYEIGARVAFTKNIWLSKYTSEC